jgi:type VI secretion system protein ImpK
MFADWGRRPLQEEVFGGAMAGELFFQYLQQLLGRQDSEDLADVLEVYQLCLLLGFKGRYSVTHGSELQVIAGHVAQKIERARGRRGELSARSAIASCRSSPSARVRRPGWRPCCF